MRSRLLAVAMLLAPAVAAADHVDHIKVAVVPGVAVNLDAGRVDALTQDLAEALAAELEVDAIGGLEVRRQLPPEGLQPDCVATPACTADVAKRIGAQQLLFVVLVDSGGAIQVDATWIEPSSGKSASRPAIDLAAATDTEAKAKFATAAPLLLPDAKRRPKPKQSVDIHAHVTGQVPRHVTVPAMITGGAAIVGLGVAIGFGIETRSKYNACNADPRCYADDPRRDTIRHDGVISDVGSIVAVGGAIATLVLYATSGDTGKVIVAPRPEGGATATLSGRF